LLRILCFMCRACTLINIYRSRRHPVGVARFF
jgi:hypothetical protein